MLEPCRDTDLAPEPLGAGSRGRLREQDLERHGTVVPKVACEVDHPHPAAPQLALDRVAIGERLANCLRHSHASALG
jgi:hypothetical protein